jgi:hypothetical protein
VQRLQRRITHVQCCCENATADGIAASKIKPKNSKLKEIYNSQYRVLFGPVFLNLQMPGFIVRLTTVPAIDHSAAASNSRVISSAKAALSTSFTGLFQLPETAYQSPALDWARKLIEITPGSDPPL